jgi:hypothetical protein
MVGVQDDVLDTRSFQTAYVNGFQTCKGIFSVPSC